MKNILKKMKALAVAGMTMGLALGAQAETIKNVKYIDANGVEQTCAEATLVTNGTETIKGWCVVTGTVECVGTPEIPAPGIEVDGAAHLILADGCLLTATGHSAPGIRASYSGNSLAIYGQSLGTGTLIAKGENESAGIGGGYATEGYNITINGGTVTATGGDSGGAGIGGGGDGAEGSKNITINGGTVTATGGSAGAAGIGNGDEAESPATNIKVNPLMQLKAGASANPSTEVATNRTWATDVANDLAGKQYATAAIDYTLYLKEGEAYARKDDYMTNITARVASMGLTYSVADSVWTMSNFVFRTTHYTGLRAESGTVITLVGTNTIVSGISIALSIAVDIDENVTFKGDGVLNATAADISKARGLMSEGPFTVSGNACVMAKGNMRAVEGMMTEPDATAVDATTGESLTWAWDPEDEEGVYKNAQGQEATYVKLTAKAHLPDYTLVLKDGVAYKSTNDGLTTGEPVSLDGLSFEGGVWTMKNFNFKTTAAMAVQIDGTDTTTITVIGENSISNHDTGGGSAPVYGLFVGVATSLQGDGSLDITSGTSKYSHCIGVRIYKNLSIRGITLKVNGGTAEYQNSVAMQVCLDQTLTVSDATVTLIGGVAGAKNAGLLTSGDVSVSGTGKIVATAGTGSTAYGVQGNNEPQATAKDASDNELTWDSTATTYKDAAGNIATNVTLTAAAPAVQIPSKPTEIENATYAVYTNGVLSADGTVWSNGTATVVYTANAGWSFETGAMEVTNKLDTSKNPAVNKEGEVVPKLVQPIVMLGKIAQRYPWNGMLDIQYKTLYAGASCKVTFYADGKVIGTAPGTGGQSATASFDLNTVADGVFKAKSLKGVQITATIE